MQIRLIFGWPALLDFSRRQTLPSSTVNIDQPIFHLGCQLDRVGNGVTCLPSACKRSDIDGDGMPLGRDPCCKRPGLSQPGLIQLNIGMATKTFITIPLGLAVSDQNYQGHQASSVFFAIPVDGGIGTDGRACFFSSWIDFPKLLTPPYPVRSDHNRKTQMA